MERGEQNCNEPCDASDVITGDVNDYPTISEDSFKWYDEISTYDDQLRQILLSSKLLNAVPAIQKWYYDQGKQRDVFYYVIKAWRDVRESLPKQLICLLTGSAIEGASLARIFNPKLSTNTSNEKKASRVEIEMDMMFVVAVMKEEKGICPMENHPGFLRINFEEAPEFTCLVQSIEKGHLSHEDCNGKKFVSSEIFKKTFQEWQPQVSKVENLFPISDSLQVLTYHQSLEGPPAALGYSSRRASEEALEEYDSFLELSKSELLVYLEEYVKTWDELNICEMKAEKIIKQYNGIFDDVRSKQNPEDICLKYKEEGCSFAEEVVEVASKKIYRMQKCATELIPREVDKAIEELASSFRSLKETTLSIMKFERVVKMAWGPREIEEETGVSRYLFGDYNFLLMFESSLDYYHKVLSKDLSAINSGISGVMLYKSVMSLNDYFASLMENKIEGLVSSALEGIEALLVKVKDRQGEENLEWNVDMDCVPCIACSFWPRDASEWLTRVRKWPDKENVRKIADAGCHIVPKPISDSDDAVTEWRWSFSAAEMMIAHSRTKESLLHLQVSFLQILQEPGRWSRNPFLCSQDDYAVDQ